MSNGEIKHIRTFIFVLHENSTELLFHRGWGALVKIKLLGLHDETPV
jgi:hypothetical protein